MDNSRRAYLNHVEGYVDGSVANVCYSNQEQKWGPLLFPHTTSHLE